MTVCIIVGILAFVGYWIAHRKKARCEKMILCFAICALFGAAAQWRQEQDSLFSGTAQMERNKAGDGSREADLIMEVAEWGNEYEMQVEIPEEQLTQEKCMELLKMAQKEIDETFLGENQSLDEVTGDVVPGESYQGGLVEAEWSFDPYEIFDTDGTLQLEMLSEEGTLVHAVCDLSCRDYQSSYEFYFMVKLPEQTEEQKLLRGIKEELAAQEEVEETTEFYLPSEVNGHRLTWKEKKSRTAYQFLALGIVLAIGVRISEVEKEHRQEKERKMLLTMEYPEIVNKLSLLLGAGMTLNHAWNQISASYDKKRKKNGNNRKPAYEEMLITCREMESGVGEKKAYEHFGERCGLRRYQKLSSLLVQNSKKGTRGLSLLLEQESEDAFEERKNMAKKYAEEAGTKLLFPMILMLGIVIVIIMVPAILSFQL